MRLFNYCFGVLMMLLAYGCNDKPEETSLVINPGELTFATEGGSLTMTVESNADWTIVASPDWVTLSAISGVYSQEVVATADFNEGTAERSGVLTIRSNDGQQLRTINVLQQAQGLSKGMLYVEDTSTRCFGGLQSEKATILVESNVEWTVTGPEWLNVVYNYRYTPLSEGVTLEGTQEIELQTAGVNKENEDLEGVVRFTSKRTREVIEIPVVQLGALNARVDETLTLADGFAVTFKTGCYVDGVLYKIAEGRIPESERTLTDENMSTWGVYHLSNEGDVIAFDGATPNTEYELVTYGISVSAQRRSFYGSSVVLTTPYVAGQPYALIESFYYDNDSYSWLIPVKQYNNAAGYYTYYTERPDVFNYNKSLLAWFFKKAIENGKCDLYTVDNTFQITTGYHVMIEVWAANDDGELSPLVHAVNTQDYYEAPAKAPGVNALKVAGCKKTEKLSIKKVQTLKR